MRIKSQWALLSILFFALAVQARQQSPPSDSANHPAGNPDWSALMDSMQQMDASMMSVGQSGNSDVDFVRLMLPHHQAAIDMGSGEPSVRQAERVRLIQRQEAIRASHLLPVVFVGRSTTGTDLIVLAIAAESWPCKSMEAKFSEESLQDSHVCRSLRTDQTRWRDLLLKAACKSI